jgi:hypothetical protein
MSPGSNTRIRGRGKRHHRFGSGNTPASTAPSSGYDDMSALFYQVINLGPHPLSK